MLNDDLNNPEDIKKIEFKLKVDFKDKNKLKNALIHRSYLNEHHQENLTSNERLEFLGDSILSFWVSKNLFSLFPELPEGILTNMRTRLVRTETLAKIGGDLSLGEFLLLSRGEEKGGGRKNKALLANTFEAVLGAIFLDKGLVAVEKFLDKNFKKIIGDLKGMEELKDPKSLLQEKIQTKVKFSPEYKVLKEEGPDHSKTFEVGVFSSGKMVGRGFGKSKQEAEENAAKDGLENWRDLN